jgi:hypothetical protein
MKKLWLMLILVLPAWCDWVLLGRQQGTSVTDITFSNIISDTYEDYAFIVDMAEPLGGFSDVVMQLSNDGVSTWLNSYTGGAANVSVSGSSTGTLATSKGIPLTNVANGGYYFIGQLFLSNATGLENYGPLSISGTGRFGGSEAGAHVYGSCNASPFPNSVRFVSSSTLHPVINRISVTVYGLTQF